MNAEDRAVRLSAVDPATLRLLREELVAISRRGYDRGLVAGVSGNNSIRIPGSDLVLIKTTGCCQGDMDTADTVVISMDGEVLEPGKTPSKEWRWHTAIYLVRPDVGAVVHLHPPHCVAFAVANRVPMIVHTAARGHVRRIEMVDLLPAGSPELAEVITSMFSDGELRVALMREHGAISVGPDLRTAYFRTEYLEDNAKVAILATLVNAMPPEDHIKLAEDHAPFAED